MTADALSGYAAGVVVEPEALAHKASAFVLLSSTQSRCGRL